MILDLALPSTWGDLERRSVGIDLLGSADEQAVTTVVVTSIHNDPETLKEVLRGAATESVARPLDRGNALDFVPKPFDRGNESLFRSVVQAYKCARVLRSARWHHFCEQRAHRWRLVQSCSLADRMGRQVAEEAAELRDRIDELGALLERRFHLNLRRDTEEPICQALARVRDGSQAIADRFAQARRDFGAAEGGGPSGPQLVLLEPIVRAAVETLRPGIVYKGIALRAALDGKHGVHTFPQDVATVVEELLFHAVSDADAGSPLEVAVSRAQDTLTADVRVHTPAPLGAAAEGALLGRDEPSGPGAGAWALSLVRRVAYNMGASLSVATGAAGSTITLQIPVTGDDERPDCR
jgi:hypothetical protein